METNNMNPEGENAAAPSCAPSTTPSAAGAKAAVSAAEPAAEPAAPQGRPTTSFFHREGASTGTRVAAAASIAAAAGTAASRQSHCLSSLLLWRSRWHAQAPCKAQDAASTKNRWTLQGRDPAIPSMAAND